ncbi:MAG: glycosyltransferase, partial [Bacteroidota bacterium]
TGAPIRGTSRACAGGSPTAPMVPERLFLSTYSCDPARGSELTVGWNRILQAARHSLVWAVTEDRGQQQRVATGLEAAGVADRVHMTYLAHDATERRAMSTPGLFYWAYRRWQRRALAVARGLHAEVGFDLIHHVNMVGYREPGDLWRLAAEARVPFVLGPVGGTQNTPEAFLWNAGRVAGLKEAARTVANRLQLRFSPRVHAAAREASAVLAANSTGQRDLARVGIDSRQLLETGAPPAATPRLWRDREPGPFRLLWVSVFDYRKALHLMLAAHARLRASGVDVHLTLVGDGRYRHLIPTDDPSIDWTGWRPREEVLDLYADADAFAFTSIRDTSGNVVLEALASGLPVLYLDHQGAHDMGDATCGIPIPVETPEQAIRDLASGVEQLAADPVLYDALSAGAIERARAQAWDANGAEMQRVYATAMERYARRQSRPGLWPRELALRVPLLRPLLAPVRL